MTLVNTSRIRSTPNTSAKATTAANPTPTIAPVRVPATSPSRRDGVERSPATTRGRVTTYAATMAGAAIRIRLKVTCSPTSSRSANRVYSPTSEMYTQTAEPISPPRTIDRLEDVIVRPSRGRPSQAARPGGR